MPNNSGTNKRWAALEIPDFRFLMATRFATFMALQAQAVVVGWQVYQLRQDALLLGLIGLAEALPAIGCAFISGHVVDTHRPAAVIRASLVILFLNTIMLFAAVSPALAVADDYRLALLFLAVFISGAARAFFTPAVFSLIPVVVPRRLIAHASAWSSSIYQLASIAGPALGGLIFGSFGTLAAFATPLVLQLAALVASFGISRSAKIFQSNARREPFLQSISSGLRFTFGHPVLISSMLLDMFSVLFGGAVAVLPIFADQVLHVGSVGLGWLRAAPAIGSVVIAIVLAIRPMKVISGQTLLWAVAGFGASTLCFGISTNYISSLIFLALSGAFDGVSMVIRSTILQLLTPEEMRGRISSVNSVFITSSNEIGAFESGLAARAMGLVPSVIFGGAMTLLVVAATLWIAPELRKTRIKTSE